MKTTATIALATATAFTLAACAPVSTESTADAPQATVVDSFIGKRLVSDTTTFLFMADGTMGGTLGGEAIVGAFTADAREVCSTYSAPESLTGREFCSTPQISGNQVVFNRRDGSQSQVYTLMN